jgi:hypothetical protein
VTMPGRTANDRSSTAMVWPYRLVSDLTSIMSATMPRPGRRHIGARYVRPRAEAVTVRARLPWSV